MERNKYYYILKQESGYYNRISNAIYLHKENAQKRLDDLVNLNNELLEQDKLVWEKSIAVREAEHNALFNVGLRSSPYTRPQYVPSYLGTYLLGEAFFED